jgi:hypothetical protein
LSGLTPEIEESKAIALALKQLRIRCPICSAIVEVTEPLGSLLWKTQEKVAGFLLQRAERSLSSLVREALHAEMARRTAEKQKERNRANKTVQRPGASRFAQRQIERHRRLAPSLTFRSA